MLALELELETDDTSPSAVAPRVYYLEDSAVVTGWVAEGTDGNLYLVPSEAGGWLHRASFNDLKEELSPVCPENARTITWFVYGDVGPVTIAGA